MAGIFNLDLSSIGNAVQGIGKAVTDTVAGVQGKLTPEQQIEVQKGLQAIQQAADQAQTEIDKVEASSSNLFVSGWRPYLGWILGTAAGFYFIPKFVLATILWVIQCVHVGALVSYPEVGWQDVVTLLGGLLGFGALRTAEKIQGAQGNH